MHSSAAAAALGEKQKELKMENIGTLHSSGNFRLKTILNDTCFAQRSAGCGGSLAPVPSKSPLTS